MRSATAWFVGSVVPVGEGRLGVEVSSVVLGARVRDARVRQMPPHGLSLEEVVYPADADLASLKDMARSTRTLPPHGREGAP